MKLLIVLFAVVLLSGCNKPEDEIKQSNIQQLRIDLFPGVGAAAIGTDSEEGIIPENYILYQSFNINNYTNCQSIKLNASLKNSVEGNTCYLELYNLTNNEIITSSTILSNSVVGEWANSENLIDHFPEGDIDLTLRIKTENEGNYVQTLAAYIYIEF